MQPDIEKYMHHFDEYDMTYDEKVEYIHSIWGIMGAFVDLAFGMHPLQQVPVSKLGSTSDQVRDIVSRIIEEQ
jgi:hypothetical protein